MLTTLEQVFLSRAIELSREGMQSGQGGPFGCVIVMNDKIVGEGTNQVTSTNDPTAHAEVVAIRNACKNLSTFQLDECDVYSSCEPCPMCLGAVYWSRAKRVIYANSKEDAASIDFDDAFIYKEINLSLINRSIPFHHHPDEKALKVFHDWKVMAEKKEY